MAVDECYLTVDFATGGQPCPSCSVSNVRERLSRDLGGVEAYHDRLPIPGDVVELEKRRVGRQLVTNFPPEISAAFSSPRP